MQFELRTPLLQTCGKRLNCLLLPHDHRSLFLVSFFIGQHQGGIYLGDLFRNQTNLRHVPRVRLVVECDRPESHEASLVFVPWNQRLRSS